ncbi:MBL fold metallo-hydrolase [Paenibacillus harenae]|uniref:MBL fold metallo-hydrolase n=1 Tax=Paenibacillus harenae TaxID=306543 RepID=UPI002791F0A1|nr:MBL fold metallo-hydrolase [Paenibacillus harenae]MDQ0060575.1 L-ascorbate metabolism protein UlaG (beta-lactamase superfamily) [Paenibacillus harenae]
MRFKRFANIEQVEQHNSLKQFKRWRQERIRKLKMKDYSFTVPNAQPDIAFLQANRKQPSITWVGHSTFLIQIGGLNIITDPVWAGQMAFQKRLAPPGIQIEDVPPIDIVLISHSHYDHLNINSLRRLGGPRQLIVPAGLSQKLKLKGFLRVKELHWWESIHIHGIKFTFVPSQHWTRRNPWDTNSSHWGGWVIEPVGSRSRRLVGYEGGKTKQQSQTPHVIGASEEAAAAEASPVAKSASARNEAKARISRAEEKQNSGHAPGFRAEDAFAADAAERPVVSDSPTIYFAGDSGYFQGFKEIGRRFPIDVALMPIGAYEPEWFMGPQHVTPEQALQAFEDTGAKWFVPMHYGAFKLADDTPSEAICRLEAARQAKGIDPSRLVVLPHGESWRLAGTKHK